MTVIQRIRTLFMALLMFLCVVILIAAPEHGYKLIVLILSLVLMLSGIRSLLFYFTMSRHMVGGQFTLFQGLIALDLGMFAYTLQDIPPIYIVLYLLIVNLFSGVIDVLRAMEARRLAGRWKLNLAIGIANILLAVFCGFCMHSIQLLSYVYAAGLLYSACLRVAQAFSKTAIIYIS